MIRLRNLDSKDGVIGPYSRYTFFAQAADTDYLINSTSIATSVAGDELTLTQKWMPVPMSVLLTVTDAALTTLTLVLKIEGFDQFGRPQTELITSPTGGGAIATHGTKVWRNIKRVSLKSITANAASDTLILGFTSASTSIVYGLPYQPRKVSATGVGGTNDTVKVVFRNGAVDTNFTVSTDPPSIGAVSVTAGQQVIVVGDLAPLLEQ